MLRHSLRFRITVAFCLFGMTLSIIYAAFIMFLFTGVEDKLFNRQLELEFQNYLDRLEKDPDTPLPNTKYINAYRGKEKMTPFERDLVGNLGEGFHELDHPDTHAGIKRLPDGDILYMIYNTAQLEINPKYSGDLGRVLTLGLILIIAVGIWLGRLTSRRIIAPIVLLGDYVKRAGPDRLPTNFSQRFYDDEVGLLARTLEQGLVRIEQFVDREKQFTRDASHELRTPVTVIKGALEVIQTRAPSAPADISRPLQRMDRAVRDLENTLEILLWLSREDEPLEASGPMALSLLVEEAAEQEKHWLKGKDIETKIIGEADPMAPDAALALKLAAANLIRNAYQNTTAGKVTISIREDHIEVMDTGAGIPSRDLGTVTHAARRGKQSRGMGMGLNIVDRLCRRFGWRLDIDSEVGRGTRVRLFFSNV